MSHHLPNFITFLRIILAPVLAVLIEQSQTGPLVLLAFGLFCLAGLSDWLDGYLARRLNIVSSMGRMLDPIADKLLIAAVLLGLSAQRGAEPVFLIPALAIVMREFLVSGLREYLAGSKVIIKVSWAAKWKTALQMVSLGCLIISPALSFGVWVDYTGLTLLWLSAALTAQTGLSYFIASRAHFR